MSKNIRFVYLYLVTFIALGMVVIGIVTAVNSITSYYYPSISYYYSYDTDEDGTSYNKEQEIRVRNAKISSLKGAISSFSVVVIGGAIYTYHWKKIQKERNEEA